MNLNDKSVKIAGKTYIKLSQNIYDWQYVYTIKWKRVMKQNRLTEKKKNE